MFYAALIIGVLDFVLKKYYPRAAPLFIYALTILLLLWRPQGLFGRSQPMSASRHVAAELAPRSPQRSPSAIASAGGR